jgi:hypothetical protein
MLREELEVLIVMKKETKKEVSQVVLVANSNENKKG